MFRNNRDVERQNKEAELEQLRFISESIERTNKITIDSEVRKRLDKHRRLEEIKLEDRRQRLLELLLCEAKLEQSLGHQKLAAEKKSRREILIEEAARYRQMLELKNKELAEAKYDLQFYLNSPELRNRVQDLHAQEIRKDWVEIQKIKEQDALDEAEWERQLLGQKSHFDEQLEREAEQHQVELRRGFEIARENERHNKELKQLKEDAKQARLREEKAELEKLKMEEVRHSEIELEKRQQRIEEMQREIEHHRKRKSDELKLEKLVENYCYPQLKSEPVSDRRDEIKRVRDEQLRFIQYKKEMDLKEQCFERYIDQQYLQFAKEQDRQLCAKRKLERAKYLEIEKEIMANNRRASDLKLAKEREEYLERLKLGEQCRLKQKELEDQIKHEEALIRQKQVEFGQQLAQQKELMKHCRQEEKQHELELEQKILANTESDYQKRMEKMLGQNPLYRKLHPWRKYALGIVDSKQC